MSFLDYNNVFIGETNWPVKKRDPLVFWPSEASIWIGNDLYGPCHRSSYWKIKGKPVTNVTDIDTKRKGKMGKAFEESEIEVFKENPLFTDIVHGYRFKNIEVWPGIPINGEFDALVKRRRKTRIIEFKSGGGYYFRKDVFGNTRTNGFPKIPNLMQVMIYLDISTKIPELHKLNIDTAELYYIDREKCKTKAFTVTLNNRYAIIDKETFQGFRLDDIYKRYQRLREYVVSNKLPPAEQSCYISTDECDRLYEQKNLTKYRWQTAHNIGYGCDIACEYCNYLHKCQKVEGYRDEYKEH